MPGHSATDVPCAAGADVRVRVAVREELASINHIVAAAVLAWPMAQRVKRIALQVLRYDRFDFDDMEMLVAEANAGLVGMAAWDAHTLYRSEAGERGTLLHGLYVHPQMQRVGVGSALQRYVVRAAADRGFDGLLVKSERVSVNYFERCGYERLSGDGAFGVHYPYLFWRGLHQ